MKKFLSILLALAVGFTFTFGSAMSAFATPANNTLISADKARELVKAEYDAAVKGLDNQMAGQLATDFPGTSVTNDTILAAANTAASEALTVDKAVVEKVMKEKIYDVQKAKIDKAYDEVCRAIETAIAADDFVSFTTGTSEPGYPKFDITDYAYVSDSNYASGVTSKVDAAADFALGTANDSTDDGLEITLAKAQYKAVSAAAVDAITAVNPEHYSNKIYGATEKSSKEIATEERTQALNIINNIETPTTVAGAITSIASINEIYTAPVNAADPTGYLFVGHDVTPKFIGLNKLLKTDKEATAEADLKYAQTETKDYALNALATDKAAAVKKINDLIRTENAKAKPNATKLAELNEGLSNVNAAYDAAVETLTYIVENAEEVNELGEINVTTNLFTKAWTYTGGNYNAETTGAAVYNAFKAANINIDTATATGNLIKNAGGTPLTTLTIADCESRALKAAEAKKQAEADKINVGLDGAKAVEIEKALEEALYDCYFKNVNSYVTTTSVDILQKTKADLIGNSGKLATKVNEKTYDTIYKWNTNAGTNATVGSAYPYTTSSITSTYCENVFDQIRAICKETEDAVNAATTVADTEAAFLAGYAKFDAIPTKAEHEAMFTKAGALYTDFTKYCSSVKQLAKGIEAVHDATDYAWITTDKLAADTDSFYAEFVNDLKECYTTEEMKAVYDAAIATLNNLKTSTALKEEKKNVETAISNLPKAITVVDKEAVAAARKAYDEYTDYITALQLAGNATYSVSAASGTILTNAEKTIFNAELKALNDEITPLVKKLTANTLTSSDKAAVDALRTKVDAFVKSYTLENDSNARIAALEALVTYDSKALSELEEKVTDLVIDDLVKAIAALDVNNVDKEAVAAAKAAYNALSEEDKLAFRNANSAAYDKLIALEKIANEANKFTDADAKAYVFDQATKATSVKLGAKKVKVTANFDASKLIENGYTVEYKFYKSTKKSSGYKYTGVTKPADNATYTNTNAKKGKNYYKFKIVVKNADGTVILTTALKDCKYACRTIK